MERTNGSADAKPARREHVQRPRPHRRKPAAFAARGGVRARPGGVRGSVGRPKLGRGRKCTPAQLNSFLRPCAVIHNKETQSFSNLLIQLRVGHVSAVTYVRFLFVFKILLLLILFFLFLNLTYSRWTSSLPSCLWSLRIFPCLPGSRLTIFYRDASSALLQLVNQWLNFTYSRSHAFRYERTNTNPTLVRIELD